MIKHKLSTSNPYRTIPYTHPEIATKLYCELPNTTTGNGMEIKTIHMPNIS
jgi:hypothetical protein